MKKGRLKKDQLKDRQTIMGIITAADWDGNDRVIAVKLSGTDENEYLIENGDEFLVHERRLIKANGTVTDSGEREKSILIEKYWIL